MHISYNLAGEKGVVITGQPGIGKTTFLLYLLLRCLEQKIAVAFQTRSTEFIIFDSQGAQAFQMGEGTENMPNRLGACLVLSDSNAHVLQPHHSLLEVAPYIVQAASGKLERRQGWSAQKKPGLLIAQLPSMFEIAAIAKEEGHDPKLACAYALKYGPSLRILFHIIAVHNSSGALKRVQEEQDSKAHTAAGRLCDDPESYTHDQGELNGRGSTLVFVRPAVNPADEENEAGCSTAIGFIPTQHLRQIWISTQASHDSNRVVELFRLFSKHTFTIALAGHIFEHLVHKFMSTDNGHPVPLKNGQDQRTMQPTSNIMTGIVETLKGIMMGEALYWIPAVVNFPGIDSVLVDQFGNIFLLQCTISSSHRSPKKGLEKVWQNCTDDTREHCNWHLVLVAPTENKSEMLVKEIQQKYADDLKPGDKAFSVWGCVASV